MKCIILASGKGLRMRPLTAKTPKPMLKVNGKPIITYVLESLPDEIDEVIIVVKYLGNQIKKYIGIEYHGKRVRYVTGSDKGNAYSFLNTRKHLKDERFLLIYGDEMPNSANVKKCLSKKLSVLTFEDSVKDGVMVLNTDIFNYKPKKDAQFSTMVDLFIRDHKVTMVKAKNFIGEINTPEQLERLNG
jgi:NDP-sugar pyrophosphorylase family protein